MLLVSAVFGWALARSQAEGYQVRLHEFPMTIGSWKGRDVELNRADRVFAVLETSALLHRVYANPDASGEIVNVLVTYFERGHRGFHPPEVSFVASGNTILKSGVVRIPLSDGVNAPQLEANMFLGRTPTGHVLFLYWFGIGDRLMASYYKGSAYLLWNAILQQPGPASMVRVAIPMPNDDLDKTMGTAREFIRQVVPVLPEYLTERPRADSLEKTIGRLQ